MTHDPPPGGPDAAAIAAILRWNGIEVPNAAARQAIADLAGLIAEIEAVRDDLRFEDEPSAFDAALLDCREPPR